MSKVYINFQPIETSAVPAIDNVATLFSEAIASLQQVSVPGDFYKRDTFLNTISSLKKHVSTLNDAKIWLIESNKNYNGMIDKFVVQANKMPVIHVRKRGSVI